MDFNKVILTGRVGSDIELKQNENGKVYARINFAVKGKKEGETNWFSLLCFDKQAELINSYCKKGSRLLVSGDLSFSSYVNKEGVNKQINNVFIKEFVFLDKKESFEDEKKNPF